MKLVECKVYGMPATVWLAAELIRSLGWERYDRSVEEQRLQRSIELFLRRFNPVGHVRVQEHCAHRERPELAVLIAPQVKHRTEWAYWDEGIPKLVSGWVAERGRVEGYDAVIVLCPVPTLRPLEAGSALLVLPNVDFNLASLARRAEPWNAAASRSSSMAERC